MGMTLTMIVVSALFLFAVLVAVPLAAVWVVVALVAVLDLFGVVVLIGAMRTVHTPYPLWTLFSSCGRRLQRFPFFVLRVAVICSCRFGPTIVSVPLGCHSYSYIDPSGLFLHVELCARPSLLAQSEGISSVSMTLTMVVVFVEMVV